MRRFINSYTGKAVSGLTAVAYFMACALPYFTLGAATRAEAQLQAQPTWAVVEFENTSPQGGSGLGQAAADAVSSELGKTGKFDVVAQETIQRALTSIGIGSPPATKTSLLRLAQEVRASTVVTGEVVNWRVVPVGGGKQADVILRVLVTDVASGLAINGAALSASSTVRADNVPDATVINEAIGNAASGAVAKILAQTLPNGTVLNTLNDTALINQGARSGFQNGQSVIVTRGREQVATATVYDVESDSAYVRIASSTKGIQPGDKVRVVFRVPDVKTEFGANGGVQPVRRASNKSNSGFVTTLLVLGLVAVLLGSGNGGSGDAVGDVKAEAGLFPDASGEPGTKVSWTPNLFHKANDQRIEWQIWRNDILASPVMVVPGNQTSGIDNSTARDVTWGDFAGVIGGSVCDNTSNPTTTATAVAGVTPGRPYNYSVALVYKVNSVDLPGSGGTTGGTGGIGGGTGGIGGGTTGGGTTGGGTIGGGTTGGGTTGGTGGTGGTTGGEDCFFVSQRTSAKGLATPYARPLLVSPGSNAVVSTPIPFSFNSVVNPAFPTTVEYVVQLSTSPNFTKSQTVTIAKFQRTDSGILSTPIVNTSQYFSSSTEMWWRIGCRNVSDNPGPVKDANGERYIFGSARRFTRPSPPPPPPAE